MKKLSNDISWLPIVNLIKKLLANSQANYPIKRHINIIHA